MGKGIIIVGSLIIAVILVAAFGVSVIFGNNVSDEDKPYLDERCKQKGYIELKSAKINDNIFTVTCINKQGNEVTFIEVKPELNVETIRNETP